MAAFWWLAGTIVASGLMVTMPGRKLFLCFFLLGLACLGVQWSLPLELGCGDGCSPGHQMGAMLLGQVATFGTLIFVPAALFRAIALYRRR